MDLRDYCYICYSVKQYDLFKEKRIHYFKKGIDENTGKMFYIYPKTKEVLDILDKWNKGHYKNKIDK